MTSQTYPDNDASEESAGDLVYALASLPGFQPGEVGYAFAGLNSGLQRTADGGQNWQDALAGLNLSEPLPVTTLAVSPDVLHDGLVFAGTSGGIFKSGDSGETWKAVLLPPPAPMVSAMAISPNFAQDSTLFAGTMEDGIFVSQDAGVRWTAWNFGLLDLAVMCLGISPNFAVDETLFAGTETGIFRSTNGGRAWREVELPFGFDAVISLSISPAFGEDHRLYASTENQGIWVSNDEGEHWSRLAEGLVEDPVNHLLVAGNELLAVTADALWYSADGGVNWENRLEGADAGLEISAVLPPQAFGPGSALLVGMNGGDIQVI
jgi:photosystem II stability/assembly factor-like uncharacterized protein